MKKKYIQPLAADISIESSVLMLSNEGNASFKIDDNEDAYEGDFKSSRFEWNTRDE